MSLETSKKTYSSPQLNKLTTEQANLILIGHAGCGDRGAIDLLAVLYPPAERRVDHAGENCEDEGLARIRAAPSRIIHRALTAFQSTREEFRRFVRG